MPKITKAQARRLYAAAGEKLLKARAYFAREGKMADGKKSDVMAGDCFKMANKLK